jgi:hypothetical protein
MNRELGIPRQLDALREDDIPALAAAACREADLNYPVPRVMTQQDCEALLREVLPAPSKARRGRAARADAASAAAPRRAPRPA